jgi:hypothetical protein
MHAKALNEALPIVPHEVARVDCCGCIVANVEGETVKLFCNECGAVVGTVNLSILTASWAGVRESHLPVLRQGQHLPRLYGDDRVHLQASWAGSGASAAHGELRFPGTLIARPWKPANEGA